MRRRSRRTRRGAALAAALLLAACGFQPMYARPDGEAAGPIEQMAAVRVAPLPDRTGQQLHNFLRDRLNPRGQPSDPLYLLSVQVSEVRQELGVQKDETATRANLVLTARFILTESASRRVLVRGNTSTVNSFNILTNEFATIAAETDARERALRELADSIRTRLGIYFSRTRAAQAS